MLHPLTHTFAPLTIEWGRLLLSLAVARLGMSRRNNTRDYARYWMGARFLERSGLEGFIARFHGLPAEEIDIAFAEKRMKWVADAGSIRNRLMRLLRPKSAPTAHEAYVRPKEGFSKLYDVVRHKLESCGASFCLGAVLTSVTRHGDSFSIQTSAATVKAGRLVSTIPLARILALCSLRQSGPLPMIELISLFFSFSGRRGFAANVLYNFSRTGRWKRLTMFSDHYGAVEGREYFAVEVNAWEAMLSTNQDPVRSARDDFLADIARKGLFDGDLRFEGSHRLPNAYPTYPAGAMGTAGRAISDLRELGVESLGRQGGFDYLPTAHEVTTVVEAALTAPSGCHNPGCRRFS
jgi:hypothetical protein